MSGLWIPRFGHDFDLRCFQVLSTWSVAAQRCIGTTGPPVAPDPCSSRTQGSIPSRINTSRRYYRTVSRRTEPSSCGTLMDVQPNPWLLLHNQDVPSRQRCTKPRGRFIQLFGEAFSLRPKRFVYSRPRRACYPRGSLFDSLISHQ